MVRRRWSVDREVRIIDIQCTKSSKTGRNQWKIVRNRNFLQLLYSEYYTGGDRLIKLSWPEIASELTDFLDVEGDMNTTTEEGYWYTRGAVEFAQHLKAAACQTPIH